MAATAVMRGQMNKYCFIQSQFILTQFYTLFQRRKSGGQAKRRLDCRGTRIVMPNRVICFVAVFYVEVVCRVMFMSLKKLLHLVIFLFLSFTRATLKLNRNMKAEVFT